VHEIVHPFMAANFPDCPAWFNEGLASLYEQSSERDGKIIGLTNWRLAVCREKSETASFHLSRNLLIQPVQDFTAAASTAITMLRLVTFVIIFKRKIC